jgi:uncharacterized membrane protein
LVLVGSSPFWVPWLDHVPAFAWLARPFDAWFTLHCHREAERSLIAARLALPVCVRCASIYVGLALGAAIARPRLEPAHVRLWVGVAALVMVLDVLTEALQMRPEWAPLRAFTGLLLAYPVGAALVNAARARTAEAPP